MDALSRNAADQGAAGTAAAGGWCEPALGELGIPQPVLLGHVGLFGVLIGLRWSLRRAGGDDVCSCRGEEYAMARSATKRKTRRMARTRRLWGLGAETSPHLTITPHTGHIRDRSSSVADYTLKAPPTRRLSKPYMCTVWSPYPAVQPAFHAFLPHGARAVLHFAKPL